MDGGDLDCEDPEAEIAVADATISTGEGVYVNPLRVDNSVGEEASTDEEMEVLLEVLDTVEFVVSAAVSAATTDGSMVATELDAEGTAAALATTSSGLGVAKGYAGTVKSLGKGGTEGTEGRKKLGAAGTDGTEGTEGTDGTEGRTGSDATVGTAGIEGTAGGDGSDSVDVDGTAS